MTKEAMRVSDCAVTEDRKVRPPWEWRKAQGGWLHEGETNRTRLFHAYDVNDHAACAENMGLMVSAEEPNEGSRLCPLCVEVVKTLPEGRDEITYE